MSSDVVIRAEGLGKKYFVGHQAKRDRANTLRDEISRAAGNFKRTAKDILRGRPIFSGDEIEEFWALRDVDFEIRRGEAVGIIGRNGAGKSTLLKVLSRITEPSEGRVTIKGRLASLLEVGTGFHPELSGRENIYLNGAILGMTRAEIRSKFDEIVDFAGVEQFLDTPVKRYSSGMYVRLAFAVAAHLEPEILVVDEVLAVGDQEFQNKCLGKMQDVAGHGRTVLFVSHNIQAVAALCSRAFLLQQGRISVDADVDTAVTAYAGATEIRDEFDGKHFSVTSTVVSVGDPDACPAFALQFDILFRGPLSRPVLGIGINAFSGERIGTVFTPRDSDFELTVGGVARRRLETEPIRFSPGKLTLKFHLSSDTGEIEVYEDAARVTIPSYQLTGLPPGFSPRGVVRMLCEYE